MTRQELEPALHSFRAGLETELSLLRQLHAVALQQRDAGGERDFDRFQAISDERDRLTRSLLAVEQGLAGTRAQLSAMREQAAELPAHSAILALERVSTDLVNEILACDRDAMQVLADADVVRRAALAGLERGETTLAAYRRVTSPAATHAGLLDRHG